MKRILIFGGTGMLGHKLAEVLSPDNDVWVSVRGGQEQLEKFGIVPRDRVLGGVSTEDAPSIVSAMDRSHPDVIINAVGIVKQLPSAKNIRATICINSVFPHYLAELAAERECRLITFSTDCVFSGQKGNYSENDPTDALDVYGKSKALGEVSEGDAVTIRTSIIGRQLSSGHGLLEWFLANHGAKVQGYCNSVFSGFPTVVLSRIIRDQILENEELRGVYHISAAPITKFDLLRLIDEIYQANVEIEPFCGEKVDRSLDSSRFRKATGFEPLSWREMITEMWANKTPYNKWKQ
jgi:dTDP-4-dehydrorhamnose reductase